MKENSGKINILFVLPNFDTGGSEKLVLDIARNLDKNKFNSIICVFFTGGYEEIAKNANIPFYIIHENGKIKRRFEILKFISFIIRKHNIHIVNTHHMSSLLQSMPSSKFFNHVKVICTEHTRLDYHSDVIKPVHLVTLRIALMFTDIALGVSQEVCDYFYKKLGVPQKKIVKITNGIDIKQYQLSANEKCNLRNLYRSEFNIKSDEVIIGMCANFRKQKNHPNLIRAASILCERGIHNFRIFLAGDGPELDNIKKIIRNCSLSNHVVFLGPRFDIPALMTMFDVYCLPSFFEGLPLSLIEAAAASLPAVATDVDGNREIVVNEKSGFLVSNNNAEYLASALEKLIKNEHLRKKMGLFAAEHSFKFSISTMINQYENLFNNLARNNQQDYNFYSPCTFF